MCITHIIDSLNTDSRERSPFRPLLNILLLSRNLHENSLFQHKFRFKGAGSQQRGGERCLRHGRNYCESTKDKILHFMLKITLVNVVYFVYKIFNILHIN
jgi:hypothetical protein